MNLWLLTLGMAVGAYALRLSFILFFGQRDLPKRLEQALRFVPSAVIAALVAPAFVNVGGVPQLSLGNDRLLAGALAALVAWRTKNVLWTTGIGMAALWLLQAIR